MKRTLPLLLGLLLLLPAVALAGGGPETTLVVVNGDSPLSRAVANEYVKLRDIPESHVVHLRGIPHFGVVDLDFFKERIWAPIEQAMKERGIEDAVDLVEYSADFPYGVNFRKVLDNPNPGHQVGGVAALTGVTYLARHVLAGDPFWNLAINRYFRVDPSSVRRPRGATAAEQANLVRARQALASKDYAAAARAYEAFLATYRELPDAYYNFACCLSRIGEKERALDALAEAAKAGFRGASHAAKDPDLEAIRNERRFKEILESMKSSGSGLSFFPGHGFRSAWQWKLEEEPVRAGAVGEDRYWLSTELAYTGWDGNSRPEILGYLRSAAECDGTKPDGTVYILRNGDVRSTTREPYFGTLVSELAKRGRKAVILEKGRGDQDGVLPKGKDDVIGAVVGKAGFDWGKSGSRFLPGAIAEHLTSFGAHFGTPSQTKLTEFLRYGAAGSSGTVIEPLALEQKFPNPMIHVYYADGCSLAESFYQSIFGPYQLLVVGDGLARPFADLVPVKVNAPSSAWTGTVELAPKAKGAESFKLFVDGRRARSGEELSLDTTMLEDGWHDVRVVAIGPGPVETRSYVRIDAIVANGGEKADAEYRGAPEVPMSRPIEIRGRGTERIEVLCQGRTVAEGRGAKIEFPVADLGPGPVVLVPRLHYGDGSTWLGRPIRIEIVPDRPRKSREAKGETRPGLTAMVRTKEGERGVVLAKVGDRRKNPMQAALPAKGVEKVTLTGEMEAPEEGFYRILLTGHGTVSMTVAGSEIAKDAALDEGVWLPASLAKGWHPLEISYAPSGRPDLEIFLGGETVTEAPKVRQPAPTAMKEVPKIEEGDKDGLVLAFRKTVRGIGGVRLVPPAGAKSFGADLTVEHRSGYGGWREVKDARVLVSPGKDGVPAWVEITFDEVRAKQLRIRPKAGGGAVPISKAIVLQK